MLTTASTQKNHVISNRILLNWTWTLLADETTYVPPDVHFAGEEKISEDLPDNPTALDFFRLYLSDDIVGHLVTETNRYADQFIAANVIPPHSAVNEWKPTNADEMRAFLGLSLLTGLVYKPRLHLYWSGDAVYKTDILGQSMARDRYLLLLRFLHFADNDLIDTKDPDRDRLAKIRPIINLIRDRCATVYSGHYSPRPGTFVWMNRWYCSKAVLPLNNSSALNGQDLALKYLSCAPTVEFFSISWFIMAKRQTNS